MVAKSLAEHRRETAPLEQQAHRLFRQLTSRRRYALSVDACGTSAPVGVTSAERFQPAKLILVRTVKHVNVIEVFLLHIFRSADECDQIQPVQVLHRLVTQFHIPSIAPVTIGRAIAGLSARTLIYALTVFGLGFPAFARRCCRDTVLILLRLPCVAGVRVIAAGRLPVIAFGHTSRISGAFREYIG